MHRSALITPLAALALLAGASSTAAAAPVVPGEVIVKYSSDSSAASQRAVATAAGTVADRSVAPDTRVLSIRDGDSVAHTVAELNRRRDVDYAVPNVIARAADYLPNDPGRGVAGAWQSLQWNFLAPVGINVPAAWSNLLAVGQPGGRGVTVAVLDTGVAYENHGRYRRSPDFVSSQFVPGYDFVDRDTRPDDANGHGTFVAGVIGERVDNKVALTGIAYGAKILPVRVLDADGLGDSATIAAGIRYAARRRAPVINLSLEFDSSVEARQIPDVLSALRYANRQGSLVIAASGNETLRAVAYPARASNVLSVGATTEHLCQADYSNGGPGLDVVAPGGGDDAAITGDPDCQPTARPGRDIFQMTYVGSVRKFGIPSSYQGTSMAAPHVAGTAALIIASGVIGKHPSPRALEARLKSTARDLGPAGYDSRYGSGLIDAAKATTR